jgi:hypothetical protein
MQHHVFVPRYFYSRHLSLSYSYENEIPGRRNIFLQISGDTFGNQHHAPVHALLTQAGSHPGYLKNTLVLLKNLLTLAVKRRIIQLVITT